MARDRYRIIDTTKPHFMTCAVMQWLPIFTSRAAVQILLDSLTFMQQNGRLVLYAYVIMENHLHIIAEAEKLSMQIGQFKSYTARCIIAQLKQKNARNKLQMLNFYKLRHKADRDYQLWQEGSHPICVGHPDIIR